MLQIFLLLVPASDSESDGVSRRKELERFDFSRRALPRFAIDSDNFPSDGHPYSEAKAALSSSLKVMIERLVAVQFLNVLRIWPTFLPKNDYVRTSIPTICVVFQRFIFFKCSLAFRFKRYLSGTAP